MDHLAGRGSVNVIQVMYGEYVALRSSSVLTCYVDAT